MGKINEYLHTTQSGPRFGLHRKERWRRREVDMGGVFDIWFGRRLHHLMERARQPTPENILPWTLLVRTRHFDVQVDDGFGCDVVVAMAKLGG
ncbi:hypothetical protein BHE74_00045335 [Ensete ventricosum]|nr:hypothetical protein GW17_00005499 [Ensete ventricosum]RWW48602.1 hypothetical protein BHE74_00045335 [Ensete ventricosum]RZS19678.1 hypothetical protein BHM03_00052108 [Ensete ventricosum]